MTTTLPPSAPPPAPPPAPPAAAPEPPRPAPTPRRRREPGGTHLLLAELALVLVTASAVVGFGRIFSSWSFLGPLLVVAGTGHLVAAVARRRGVGLPLAWLGSMVAWVLVVTWLFFVDTTFALLPTSTTWRTARFELDRSWAAFHDIVAPAPVQTGFLLAAAAAIAAGIFLADWAAFRLWSTREAVVPALTLFVFATLLAGDQYRILSAVLLVGAMVLFVLTHRVVQLERSDGWVTRDRSRAGRSVLIGGLVLTVVAGLVGALAAPHLPGASDDAVVDWRGRDSGDNSRVLSSPLVDIRSRVVDTSNTPLFTVTSDTRSYWRMTALDQFDGRQWSLSASTDQLAAGFLATDRRRLSRRTQSFAQTFTIQKLETPWLPAAYEPINFRGGDGTVRWDAETASLIADDPTGEDTTYDVSSVVPDHTPDELRGADRAVPRSVQAATALPDDFSTNAATLAQDVTAGATNAYDQALALQTWFRDTGGFTYSTDVEPGQSSNAIDAFLEAKVGYCEQFSGTFAAMARSLGIPARVAVGYTWGETDPADPSRYQVVGRNAHAWPEVYLGQYGWVAFEPTPGRGNPDAESYTGVPASQDDGATATTTTVAPAVPDDSATSTTAPAPGSEAASAAAGSTTGTDALAAVRTGVVVLLLGAAAYLLAVPGGLALRRRQRRRRAEGSPTAEVGVAWSEATDALAGAGVRVRPDDTHAELARRAGKAVPATTEPIDRLVRSADAAAYGATVGSGISADATRAAEDVRSAVDASLGPAGRLRRFLDPRPWWRGRPRRHRAR